MVKKTNNTKTSGLSDSEKRFVMDIAMNDGKVPEKPKPKARTLKPEKKPIRLDQKKVLLFVIIGFLVLLIILVLILINKSSESKLKNKDKTGDQISLNTTKDASETDKVINEASELAANLKYASASDKLKSELNKKHTNDEKVKLYAALGSVSYTGGDYQASIGACKSAAKVSSAEDLGLTLCIAKSAEKLNMKTESASYYQKAIDILKSDSQTDQSLDITDYEKKIVELKK